MNHNFLKYLLLTNLSAITCYSSVSATEFQPFIVKQIKIEGLQRVSKDAVLVELPISIGQNVDQQEISKAIKTLYNTKFFSHVALFRDQQALIVKVEERPSIGEFKLNGTSLKDEVKKILTTHGVASGRVYDPVSLSKAKDEIEVHFLRKGRYGVKVESSVTDLPERNRVAVTIDVDEGTEAKVKHIKIVGNSQFAEKKLLEEFNHSESTVFSWLTKSDRYHKEKLQADLDSLRAFYMNRGYLNFEIESTLVSLSADKKYVYITINIHEGGKFTVDKVTLSSQQLPIPTTDIQKILDDSLPKGSTFSSKKVVSVREAIEDLLGDKGYSKADVRVSNEVDEAKHLLNLDFYIEPNKRILVRRIDLKGNMLTEDVVFRRHLQQMEGTWLSTKALKDSKQVILREGYASKVSPEIKPVAGRDDQVDVELNVDEQRVNNLNLGIAYSTADRFIFNVSANMENFLGTGKNIDVAFNNSKTSTTYSFGYFDPYFYSDHYGLGYNLFYRTTNLSKTSSVFDYASTNYGGDVSFVVRNSPTFTSNYSLGYVKEKLSLNNAAAPQEISDFLSRYPNKSYDSYFFSTSFNHNSSDKYLFPTSGAINKFMVRVNLPGSSLKWYQAGNELSYYYPINEDFIFHSYTEFSYIHHYSSSAVPFYKNLLLGGAETVRGYEERSLGPKDSKNQDFGGNLSLLARSSLIYPIPFLEEQPESLRSSVFFDIGQVYDTINRKRANGSSRNPRGLKYSAGLSFTWQTPLSIPVTLNIAKPLNMTNGVDRKDTVSFSMTAKLI